ncbi:hypothetical protein PENTCL1PPCAC_6430 [Pristionchus entomophagus]|uniref:Uncharacterized protein n=1 Tax=Pristionchus entomophagus TaxID=358040 RepID=A0AAV5SW01_9BILA|nr:hypothetical protein PENTCL1PPCAC_6430 [Pristionchus entomophagus]
MLKEFYALSLLLLFLVNDYWNFHEGKIMDEHLSQSPFVSLHEKVFSVALLAEVRSKTSAKTDSESTKPPEGEAQDDTHTRIFSLQRLKMALWTLLKILDGLLSIQFQSLCLFLHLLNLLLLVRHI